MRANCNTSTSEITDAVKFASRRLIGAAIVDVKSSKPAMTEKKYIVKKSTKEK